MTEIPVPPVSKREREIAVQVLMRSSSVRKWVESEAAFLGIVKGTPQYTRFYVTNARRIARKMID